MGTMMNIVRKLKALSVVTLLIISTATVSVFGTDTVADLTEKEWNLLSALEIMTPSVKTATVTKTLGAVYTVRLLGNGEAGQNTAAQGIFTDVPKNNEYAGYIEFAAKTGIINGNGYDNFFPNAKLTYAQTVKMIVNALGYETVAVSKGGYPYGHLAVGRDLKITGNINYPTDDPVSADLLAVLLYNALHASPADNTYGANAFVSYGKGPSLMEKMFQVKRYYGVITANKYTKLAEAETYSGNTAELSTSNGDILFDAGITDAVDYLGYNVELYAREYENQTRPIILEISKITSNSVIDIKCRDILSVNVDIAGKAALKYKKSNGSEAFASITAGAAIIYNGQSIGTTGVLPAGVTLDTLLAANAEATERIARATAVRLVDNTGSSAYNIIFITAELNYFVNSTQNDKFTVSVRPDNPFSRLSLVDLDETIGPDYSTIIRKDGKPAEFEDITPECVITVAESYNKKHRSVNISVNSITRIAGEIGDDDEKYTVIDGEKYNLAYDVNTTPDLSSLYRFYLNETGEIIYIDKDKGGATNYGWLTGVSTGKKLDTNAEFKLVSQEQRILTLKSKDKIKFNGSLKDAADVAAALKNNGEQQPQLIVYTIDNDGLINKIDTALDLSPESNPLRYDESRFTLNASGSMYFKRQDVPVIGGLYAVTVETVVFTVEDRTDPNSVRANKSTDALNNDATYRFQVFDVDRYGKAGAVVNFGLDTSKSQVAGLSWTADSLLIGKFASFIDEEGQTRLKVYGVSGGKEVSEIVAISNIDRAATGNRTDNLVLEDATDLNSRQFQTLSLGSLIQFNRNADRELYNFRLLYDPKNPSDARANGGSGKEGTLELLTLRGTVDSINGNILTITLDNGQGKTADYLKLLTIGGKVNIYRFNTAIGKPEIKSINDLVGGYGNSGGTPIFIRVNKDELRDILILD